MFEAGVEAGAETGVEEGEVVTLPSIILIATSTTSFPSSILVDLGLLGIGLRVYFSNKCTDAVTTPVAPVPIC